MMKQTNGTSLPAQPMRDSEGVVLDFSGLFEQSPVIAPEMPQNAVFDSGRGNHAETGIVPKTALTGQNEPRKEQAPKLKATATQYAEDHRQCVAVYRRYQENILKSEHLQKEILDGIDAGQSAEELFLKACEVISCMCGDGGMLVKQASKRLARRGEIPA